MKDEKKWIKDLRSQMEGYSEPLPPGMWERVERELDTPKVIPMWKRWQAVAAVGLIAVVSSLTLWFWFSPAADSLSRQGELARQEEPFLLQEDARPFPVAEPEPEKLASISPQSLEKQLVASDIQPAPAVLAVTLAEEEVTNDAVVSVEQPRKEEEVSAGSDKELDIQTRKAIRNVDRERMRNNAANQAKSAREIERKGWQVGLAAGNTPYTSSNTFGGFGRMASRADYTASDLLMSPVSDKATAYSQVLFNNRERTPKTNIHHRMPVTFGASVKWNLKRGWALETGLTYTILSSESHAGSEASYMEEAWKLHYIGIPLKVHRTIWENKRFYIYASAGGAVEKCVSGNLETVYVTGNSERETESSSLHVSELQWSLSAAAGAQVNFTPAFGFYVEPGVAYYFDDGSEVETFRKEHPLNFNLQLGLRFSFGK